MMQFLPTEILDWVDSKDFNPDNYSNYSSIGCLLEVDLDYPDEWHDLCNDYPLSVEKIEVTKMLSDYQLQIIEYNNFSLVKNKKLMSNLGNKRKYKLYYQNFEYYLSLGLQLKKS